MRGLVSCKQDLDGRRRAIGILREERLLAVGKMLTVVGWVRKKPSGRRSAQEASSSSGRISFGAGASLLNKLIKVDFMSPLHRRCVSRLGNECKTYPPRRNIV
jgi:hypothetical protein